MKRSRRDTPRRDRKRRPRPTVRPKAEREKPTYRRNRTITDRSTVPEVSERARAHYLHAVRRKVAIVLLIIVVGAGITAFGVSQFSGSVHIVSADTSMTRSIDESTYHDIFMTYYQRHPLERFRFLTDYNKLMAVFRQQAPEVETIHPAGMGGLGVSRYELTMRHPVASWAVDEERYYVDAEGVTFQNNYYEQPRVSVVDNSGANIKEGSAIASSRLLSFVGRVVALASSHDMKITKIEIPSESMRQIYVSGRGMPQIRMTTDRAVETQVNDMTAAIRHLRKTKTSVRYVDVRVEGKAFYR